MKIFLLSLALAASPLEGEPTVRLGELVVAALGGASEVAGIKADLINRDASAMRLEASMAPTLSSQLSLFDSRAETPGGAFNPDRTRKTSLNIAMRKLTRTGTVIGSDLELNDNTIDFPNLGGASAFTPNGAYIESKFAVFARQKLLKNAFGRALRAREQSVERKTSADEYDVTARVEAYAAGVIEQFYGVWLMQTNYSAVRERLQRTKRLLRVSKVKLQRGTAEKSELLQLESSEAEINIQLSELRKKLADVWRALVVALNLAEHLAGLDVSRIRLVRESKIRQSQGLCRDSSPPDSKAVKAMEQNLAALRSEQEALVSEAKPDLFFEARVASNGIDVDDYASPVNEALAYKNPILSLTLGLDWPLGLGSEKAALLDNFKTAQKLKIALDMRRAEAKVAWTNACAELQRLEEKLRASQKILSWQKKRLAHEEGRFALGQVELFNVIQAGNDVTTAEVTVKSTRADLDLTAWQIVELHGDLDDYLAAAIKLAKKGDKP